MFKRTLVAVDGSPTSALALQEAVQLAKERQAQLRIAHVVDEATLNGPEAGDVNEVRETFRKSGHKTLEKAAATVRAAGVTAETRILDIETIVLPTRSPPKRRPGRPVSSSSARTGGAV